MATCAKCKAMLIRADYHGQTLWLDGNYKTYAAVEGRDVYPQDGDRVFLTAGLIEHRVVCSGQRREEADDRAHGKVTYDRQRQAKKGLST